MPKKVVGIILAAGQSRRMETTKQLLNFHQKPILQWVYDICGESDLSKIIIVLGHQKKKILQQMDFPQAIVVENPDYKSGQSTSLIAGLGQLDEEDDAAMFLLGDQPLLNKSTINLLIKSYQKLQSSITIPVFNEKRGNPVIFDRSLFHELEQISGDQGGRGCFNRHADDIDLVEVNDEGVLIDLDTREDYLNLLKKNNPEHNKALLEVIPFKSSELISVVGGGGKTSTIFSLANEYADKGFSVLVTTTTAIFHPDREGWKYDFLHLGDRQKVLKEHYTLKSKITVAGKLYDSNSGKIKGYLPDEIDALYSSGSFDYILVEADGSKRLPVKAPAEHEPVIPLLSTTTIGVIGLSCLGKPIDSDTVHRLDQFIEVTSSSIGDCITPSILAKLIGEEKGLFKSTPALAKKVLILNQADTTELVSEGGITIRKIENSGEEKKNFNLALICKMKSDKPVIEIEYY